MPRYTFIMGIGSDDLFRGCITLVVGVTFFLFLNWGLGALGVTLSPVVGKVLGLLLIFGLARLILNQIFD